ncbi:hypothetical protein SAMN05216456_2215 [Devosia crocina]|uniref:Uncharacterized protein n=1 Tax=Devosia crocina TaxID=429728 RepID=A0A1I7NMB4_9HYPH|nr:hypothetical protein [Devosia crocina]SFV35720.1 hypothetical protein SAMN05216456_2215 [Devosia crocina]
MKPLALGALALVSSTAFAPVLAADYAQIPELRPSYPTHWEGEPENPLKFELGLRYFYSRGSQEISVGNDYARAEDTSHILEVHGRIVDEHTSSYVKASGGYALATDGTYSTNVAPGDLRFSGGQIGHVGADFGYMPFGNDAFRIGGLVGYQYLKESPDKARADILQFDGLHVHALRLGVTAKADLGTFADITAEVAGIPYAWVTGSTPTYVIPAPGLINADRVTGTIDSAAYGASGELMLGIHPTENLTLRVGGRAWYLTGPTNANLIYTSSANPDQSTTVGTLLDSFAMFRYGGLVELTGRF